MKAILPWCFLFGALHWSGCSNSATKAPDPSTSQAKESAQEAQAKGRDDDSKEVQLELKQLAADIEIALEAEDWSRVKQLVKRGLELTEANPGKYDIYQARFLLARAETAREQSQETESRRYFADAMAIFHVKKDSKGRAETHIGLGKLEARRGDYAAAAREFAEAETLLAEVEKGLLNGIFKLETGRLASKRVERQKAKADFLEAIRIFEAEKDQKHLAETLAYLAHEEDAMGNTDQCRRHLGRALALYREMGDPEGEAYALHRLARVAEREKNYNHARTLLKKVYELYDKLDRKADMLRVERHINALPEAE